jgi:glycosyltransferase involved in cell wall biosynthesis
MGDDSGPVAAGPGRRRDDIARSGSRDENTRSGRRDEITRSGRRDEITRSRDGRPDRERHDQREVLAAIAADAGIRRIHVVAWRDLDDPEAGGSELHADKVASLWAAAGLDVTFRTSAVPGAPEALSRNGYRVLRRSGRYKVFAGAAWEGLRMGHRPGDALVEIWNGMPFLSPLWYRGPRLVFLHHVHAEMWGMVLPPTLARLGETMEGRIAPPFYRSTRIVTLSESSCNEIVERLRLPRARVTVAPPGVDAHFTPGGHRSPTPLVVAVGRLVPVKRFDALLRALAEAKKEHPALEAVVIGEGYERPALEALRAELGATEWVRLLGHATDDEVVSWYRRAWVVASSSQREGWGMTLTEAAACGTPAVATAIAGHTDAVLDGESGLLVADVTYLGAALGRVLGDEVLRSRLSKGALARARWFTWDATARRALEALAEGARAQA